MNCIIIDDEASARSVLNNLCKRVEYLNVIKEFDNAKDALAFLETNKIDLIFLDIHMPILNGYDFIDILENHPKIVLTTTDRNSAIKAFEYKCIIDYLGKPLNFPRFINAIDKVNRALQISNQSPDAKGDLSEIDDLYVSIDKKLVKVLLESIDIITTHPKGIEICTNKQNYVIKCSLSKVLEKLPKSLFIKVHQSYIVNVSKITNINNNQIFINKECIPLSRLNKAELMGRINLF